MTNEEFYALKIKLLELPDEQYYDAVIQQLNADREELMNYRMAKIPFKTRPVFPRTLGAENGSNFFG